MPPVFVCRVAADTIRGTAILDGLAENLTLVRSSSTPGC